MYLTIPNIVPYLIGRGLTTPKAVVDGDLTVIEAGRRNRNFKVLSKSSRSLFLKQVKTTAPDALMTLQREAAFYQLIRDRPAFAPLAAWIPPLVDYNPANFSLVVELLPDAENFTEYHTRTNGYPEYFGELIGRSLALCHSLLPQLLTDPSNLSVFPRQVPWVMTFDPATMAPLTQLGPLGTQLAAVLRQSPDFLQRLLAVRYEWRFDSLVHGDVKWDNYLVATRDETHHFRIIDWELVDIGDAAWDIASILGSYLGYGIMLTPDQGEEPTAVFERSRPKLDAMRPALARFWTTYTAARGIDARSGRVYLERCLRFTAARLVLAVFEYLYNATQLNSNALALLGVGQSILFNPSRAVSDILGL